MAPNKDHCIFCQIIAGHTPGQFIDQNECVAVFMSLENHPLIVPKAHIENIFGLDRETGADIMSCAVRIAKAMKQALDCDGVYVTQTNGAAAGQDVFHYHMHLYPKWADGRVLFRDDESRKASAAQIRDALSAS